MIIRPFYGTEFEMLSENRYLNLMSINGHKKVKVYQNWWSKINKLMNE